MTLTREQIAVAQTIDVADCSVTVMALSWPNRWRTAWAILRGHTIVLKPKTLTVLPAPPTDELQA